MKQEKVYPHLRPIKFQLFRSRKKHFIMEAHGIL